jgi:hypothetical protein
MLLHNAGICAWFSFTPRKNCVRNTQAELVMEECLRLYHSFATLLLITAIEFGTGETIVKAGR